MNSGERIVLVNGCFDPLHYGHVLHFRAARLLGTKLVASVTMDEYVDKGYDRPVFPLNERMNMIAELRCVDEVVPVRSSLMALEIIRPHVFVKGSEYESLISTEDIVYCIAHNIQVAFTYEKTYSSTKLLQYYIDSATLNDVSDL